MAAKIIPAGWQLVFKVVGKPLGCAARHVYGRTETEAGAELLRDEAERTGWTGVEIVERLETTY